MRTVPDSRGRAAAATIADSDPDVSRILREKTGAESGSRRGFRAYFHTKNTCMLRMDLVKFNYQWAARSTPTL